tara:strand:+ start:729 stop:1763 length:1035 start_codon:yes stop_codon:yes gene_type:complete
MGQAVSSINVAKVPAAPPHPALSLLDKMLADPADVKKMDDEENTVLHTAVKLALGTWMGEEPLIEEPDAPAPTPSEMATRLGELLRRHPAASLATAQRLHNDDGLMPFHLAVLEGGVELCEVLLQTGAPVNACTLRPASSMPAHGHMCGHWARRDKNGHVIPLDPTDQTALHLAVGGDLDGEELIRLLLQHGANIDTRDCQGRTPLCLAVTSGLHGAVQMMAECRELSGENESALHLAVLRKDVRMIRLLAEHGANVDHLAQSGSCKGWTPLCLAARQCAAGTAEALLSAGADVHATSSNGKTALQIAEINSQVRKDRCEAVLAVLLHKVCESVLEIAFARRDA